MKRKGIDYLKLIQGQKFSGSICFFDFMEKIIEVVKIGDILVVSKYIGDFKEYIVVYFGEEEVMFSATDYFDVAMHK